MAKVTTLHPCVCGKPTKPRHVRTDDDTIVMSINVCETCRARIRENIQLVKPVLATMLDQDIPLEVAHRTILYLLDQLEPAALGGA